MLRHGIVEWRQCAETWGCTESVLRCGIVEWWQCAEMWDCKVEEVC